MARPLSIFPWHCYLDAPHGVQRGVATARVRDGVVSFQVGTRQFFVKEEQLLTSYDLTLPGEGLRILELVISTAEKGYGFEVKGKANGTTKKPSPAEQKALDDLSRRGLVQQQGGQYHATARGKQVKRVYVEVNRGKA